MKPKQTLSFPHPFKISLVTLLQGCLGMLYWSVPLSSAQPRNTGETVTDLKLPSDSTGTRVATSKEIARLADSLFPQGTFPEERQEWFAEPGLENELPAGYEFRQGSLPGDERNSPAVFQMNEPSARRGKKGLWPDAGSAGTVALQARLDLDKARWYRFGGWVTGSGQGSISFSLVPVAWAGGTLKPVNSELGAGSVPLRGNFGWTEWTTEGNIRENFDYCLLRIQVQGGGQYRLDDLTVSSIEHTAHDRLLTGVLDPLVVRGFAVWSTPSGMRESFTN